MDTWQASKQWKQFGQVALTYIQSQVNEQSFRTWFEPIKPIKLNDNVISVQVPSQFFYEWLEEHYVSLLRKNHR